MKVLDVMQAAALGTTAVATVVGVVLEYQRARAERANVAYRRELQKAAWEQVKSGELAEATVGDVSIKRGSR
jgi:hypothetical protein